MILLNYIVFFLVALASIHVSTFISDFRTRAYYSPFDFTRSSKQRRVNNQTASVDISASTAEDADLVDTAIEESHGIGEDSVAARQRAYTAKIIHNHLPLWLQTYHAWHANQLAQLAALEEELSVTANGDTTTDIITSDAIRNRTQQFRFLLVVCLDGMTCGGLSDRIKAIPYWLMKANETNRILKIHWAKKDMGLEEFWVPPPGGMNWSVPFRPSRDRGTSSILQRLLYDESVGAKSCLVKRTSKFRVHRGSRPLPGRADGGPQVVCSHHQTYHFERSPDDMASYRTDRHDNSYGHAFHTLFQPSRGFGAYLERMLRGSDLGLELDSVRYTSLTPYLAVHVRSKYPIHYKKGVLVRPSMDVDRDRHVVAYIADRAIDRIIRKYVDVTGATDIPPIYVASDSSSVIRYLKYNSTRYAIRAGDNATEERKQLRRRMLNISKDVQVRIPRIIGLESLTRPHIEFITVVSKEADKQSEGDIIEASDLYPAFFDLWMLSESSCLAYGVGGYGRLAFFISMSSSKCHTVHRMKKKYSKVEKKAKEYRLSMQLAL